MRRRRRKKYKDGNTQTEDLARTVEDKEDFILIDMKGR